MPQTTSLSRKRTYRDRYRKRSGRRRLYANRRFTTNPLRKQQIVTIPGRQVLPFQLKTQFKFTFRASLAYDGTTGLSGVGNVKANSLTDPMGASGSSQPPMFDELMTFYRKYNVIASEIRITVTPRDAVPIMFYTVPILDTTQTYSVDTANNMPGMKRVLISPDNASGDTTVVNYRRSSTVTGLNQNDDFLLGSSSSDPGKLWYYHISFAPMQFGYSTSFSIDMFIELTQFTILSEPQVVSNS